MREDQGPKHKTTYVAELDWRELTEEQDKVYNSHKARSLQQERPVWVYVSLF